jgi:RNA recognition motif-containing protein
MRGLPFSIYHDDIISFFSDYNFVLDSIKIGLNANGKRTGEAVIIFQTYEDAKLAMDKK